MPTDLPPDYVPKPPDSDLPAPGNLPGKPKGGDEADPTGGLFPPTAPGDALPAGIPNPDKMPTF